MHNPPETLDTTVQELRKKIIKAARTNRDEYMANKVDQALNLRDQWFGVKLFKKPYAPQVYTNNMRYKGTEGMRL